MDLIYADENKIEIESYRNMNLTLHSEVTKTILSSL